VNNYDSLNSSTIYTLNLKDAYAKRIASKLNDQQRRDMQDWLMADGIPADQIDINDTAKLLEIWEKNYDPNKSLPGMVYAKQLYYQRLNASLKGILSTESVIIATTNPQTGELEKLELSINPIMQI